MNVSFVIGNLSTEKALEQFRDEFVQWLERNKSAAFNHAAAATTQKESARAAGEGMAYNGAIQFLNSIKVVK